MYTVPVEIFTWVRDIAYIVVGDGFAHLSLTADAYSRKVAGFSPSVDLPCIRALNMALRNNKGSLGRLTHHSDRDSQYCCSDYVGILNDNFIRISMTRGGDPKENAIVERVNGVLKDELLEKTYPNMVNDTNEKLLLQMQQGQNMLNEAYKQVQLAKISIEQAEENLRVNQNNYEAGMVNVSDMLEAQAQLQQSRDNYTEALTQYRIAKVN